MSSSGRTYWLTPRFSWARVSRRTVFTSSPTPNTNNRVLGRTASLALPVVASGARRPRGRGVGIDGIVEGQDVEPVGGVQALQDEAQRLFGLFQLLALHAPRDVQHQHHVLGHHLFLAE